MTDERTRVQSMFESLPPAFRLQVGSQVTIFRASQIARGLQEPSLSANIFQFWKALVTNLYNASGGRTALAPPPPPPKSARHPLAVPPTHPTSGFVDKSSGLLGRIMAGAQLPVGMQDWVNRLFVAVERAPVIYRSKAESFLSDFARANHADLWRTNWVALPVPTLNELASYVEGSNGVIKRKKMEVIDVDAPFMGTVKARRVSNGVVGKMAIPPPPPPPADFISMAPGVVSSRKSAVSKGGKGFGPRVDAEEQMKRSQRAEKFKEHLMYQDSSLEESNQVINVPEYEFGIDEEDVFERTEQYSVVGTCKVLEKRYLRLTSAPDPALVRPEPVLKTWLGELEKLWEKKAKTWKYIEDQMRAIRQDLTVQSLRGDFTRTVYETNARWALESADLGQFNQCQTQLKQLHEHESVSLETRCEFMSYRLLYYHFQNLRVDEQIFLNQIISRKEVRMHPYIVFAMELRSAATTNNFSKYFLLSRVAKGENQRDTSAVVKGKPTSHLKYMLHAFEAKQRIVALTVLSKAFATQISVSWLADLLGFSSAEECSQFLTEHEGVMKSETALDPKASFSAFSSSPLIMSAKLKLMG